MNLKSKITYLLCVFFITNYTNAVNLPTIDHITSNNGLSHNTIRCMLQDTTGFLWFGSLNGLNRFDGVKIKTLIPENLNVNSLSNGKIKELHKDKRGYIWIRTYSDIIHCYNPFTESFISVFKNDNEKSLKYNLYYEDKEHNIWLGGNLSGCTKISFNKNDIATQLFNVSNKALKSNQVFDVYQDSQLNTWILTSNGVKCVSKNASKIVSGIVGNNKSFLKVFEINQKLYFVCESGDIEVFSLKTYRFETIKINTQNLKVFKTTKLNAQSILISTYNSGVYVFNTLSRKFSSIENITGQKITGNAYFQTDELDNVWMYNFTGNVWLLNTKDYKALKLNLIPASIMLLIDEERFQFQSDNHNNVWITTYGNGLFCYNTITKQLTHYLSTKGSNGLSSNYLLSIYLDKNDNLWIGTENMGINKFSFSNRNVEIYYPETQNSVKNGNVVRSILEDHLGNIWVATKAGSLYKYNADFSVKQVIFDKTFNVYNIFEDNNGTIWLATRGYGVVELKNGSSAKPIFHKQSADPTSLSNNHVFSLLIDKKGRLWVATFGGGLCVKTDLKSANGFKTFFNTDEWIKFTRYVFEDKKGNIWVATGNGVIRFNPDELLKNKNAYKYFTFDTSRENSLSNPEVRYIFEDSKENIWFATAGGGINKFVGEGNDGNGIFKAFKNKQGISNDNIMAIQEDVTGTLWVSTESGLHTFNPEANLFQYFKFSDDFSSNLFSEAASFTCKDGRLIWGSMNGFYVFNPLNLKRNENETNKVILTGFFIYDLEAKIGDSHAPLQKSISYSDKITLNAADKVFHVEFANMNFRDPKTNQFMYILENYEKRWNVSGSYNIATYRNVPPGTYVFKVKSVNSQGVWENDISSLEIVINPPFWQSGFAFFLYFIVIAALVFFAFKLVLKFNKLNNEIKVEHQLTDYKLRFFTNISHEFRTPLTLIKGSVDTLNDIKSKMSEPFQHLINDMDKNTTHMLRLIEQLLEFRKLQNNKQKLNLQQVDAVQFTKGIFDSFSNVASRMNIEYSFLPSTDAIPVFFDKNKVDKIIFNLLSNAFKFTHRGGKIAVIIDEDKSNNKLVISVKDNGIGIPKEKQDLLFSRFMQINFSSTGTGIGLSLVNEFTVLHKGSVRFVENEDGGSVFILEFSLDSSVYDEDEFVKEQIVISGQNKDEKYNLSEFIIQNEDESMLQLVPNIPIVGKKYKVLVIDDNDDIRDFLSDKLNPYFEVVTAIDGNDGIHKSMEDDPDLIICDVMMPGMNGFELTKKLKDNFATCHIPVILLTAYVSDEHHTEGIIAGADAYISKPFDLKHLMLQINKLLEKRELLNKHYLKAQASTVEETTTVSNENLPEKDVVFMHLVEELLEKHLTNPDFSVDDFAAMTNTGRTLFFKKIKFLTGYSPNEFIRHRRMQKAAELLKTYKYNVSEVSYMVGINDPFYFSKCFKAQFGSSPSKYLNSL